MSSSLMHGIEVTIHLTSLSTQCQFTNHTFPPVDPSTDALYITYTAHQYAFQRSHPVSAFDAHRFNSVPEKWWDKFYSNNAANFFKDRKWLRQEFPVLDECTRKPVPDDCGFARKNVILEVGAGAGNTAFPILAGNENPDLVIHACDFSKKAVELIRENNSYDGQHIRAEVWDVASATEPLPPGVEEQSVDVVLLIFIFSALSPGQWAQAVRNLWRALKPGGEICFRDYGRGDLAQVRFKKGRWLGENFYVRGDGTRVYFFAEDEIKMIWGGSLKRGRGIETSDQSKDNNFEEDVEQQARTEPGPEDVNRLSAAHDEILNTPAFDIVSVGVDRRLLVNRQKQLKMYRCWMQGRFRKPDPLNIFSLGSEGEA